LTEKMSALANRRQLADIMANDDLEEGGLTA
jgi:hypothetical protein